MLTKYKLKFPTFIAKNHLWSATFVILRIRRGNIGDRISVKNWRSLPGSLLKLKDYSKPIRRLIHYSISTRTNTKIKSLKNTSLYSWRVTWDHLRSKNKQFYIIFRRIMSYKINDFLNLILLKINLDILG